MDTNSIGIPLKKEIKTIIKNGVYVSDCFDYYKICKGLIRFEMSRPKIAFAYFGVVEKSLKLNWYSSSCFAINCFILASLIYFPRKKKFHSKKLLFLE